MRPAIAKSFVLQLLCAVYLVNAAAAQNPGPADKNSTPQERSVKVLTDVPDNNSAKPSMSVADLASINLNVKSDNAAGLTLDIIPSGEVIAGSKIGFRLTTKKPGYLILLNVDAAGKLTQIFPEIPTEAGAVREEPSLIKPGKPLIIPQLGSPYATFEFIAEPPAGVAMFVALLSDKPVQLVDLPNAPPPAFAPGDTLKYVHDQTLTLVVPNRNGDQLERPKWSFDGKVYLIK
ncbi:MAG: DUF4384 domain-containing protein [Bradyrhizobium sp.]